MLSLKACNKMVQFPLQQALRASRCGDGESDSDENDEEEDDDEDDDEDEEEEQNQAGECRGNGKYSKTSLIRSEPLSKLVKVRIIEVLLKIHY
jgi:TATA-binding protein-associated factor Taf7